MKNRDKDNDSCIHERPRKVRLTNNVRFHWESRLPYRFSVDVDPAYEKWETVDASCIADVREITTACIFQEPVDEERLSEMLAVSLHLNNNKPLKLYMANNHEKPDILLTLQRYCRPETESTFFMFSQCINDKHFIIRLMHKYIIRRYN